MSQDALFLVAVAAAAAYTYRLALRLAPPTGELPVKTLVAGLLAALVAFAGVLPYEVGSALRSFTLVVAPAYAFAAMYLTGIARTGGFRLAGALVDLLYWTPEGRRSLRRLLAQTAIHGGDGDAALALVPERDPLLQAQALLLREDWSAVLDLELPREGDNSFLGDAARIEALVRLGRLDEAGLELDRMRSRWEAGPQGPLGYRSVTLSEARLAAEGGDMAELARLLARPMAGAPAHQVLALLGRGAERAGRPEDAARFYGRAAHSAPRRLRERYASRVTALGFELPRKAEESDAAVGTFVLAGLLGLAYMGQLWLDASAGPFSGGGAAFRASSLAAAYLLGMPGLPEADAWWRYLSYAFVHGNFIHILFNVWVLLDIGRAYEARRGRGGLLISFAAGTAAGAAVTHLLHDGGPLVLVGASGGVLGVAGALLAHSLTSTAGGDKGLAQSLLRWMALIVLLSLAIPNVSLWGHIGGIAGGLLWGLARRLLPASPSVDRLAGGLAAASLVAATASAVMMALRLASI